MQLMDLMSQPVCDRLKKHGMDRLAAMYRKCYACTWETTLQRDTDSVFLVTGDIPAMWLRDSSAQVFHYLDRAAEFPEVMQAIRGLLRRQFMYICLDPYANAWNRGPTGTHYADRSSFTEEARPWIWERKYEIDSLCYPVRLAYSFWKTTGDTSWCDDGFRQAVQRILETWRTEQHHMEASPYYFVREHVRESDTLPFDGKGTPVTYTGMTWSGFRPSDDACRYGYLIPSNFFCAVTLDQIREIASVLCHDPVLAESAGSLASEIRAGLEQYARVHHPEYGDVFAYEVDGNGHALLMDDANVPSLLSLPYLGCVSREDPVYQATRAMLLSPENPYYYAGEHIRGIGSPHTPESHVWPISLCIQGLTSNDAGEMEQLARMLQDMDAGTLSMHESVYVHDPSVYTRAWFAWADSIFCEFMDVFSRTL